MGRSKNKKVAQPPPPPPANPPPRKKPEVVADGGAGAGASTSAAGRGGGGNSYSNPSFVNRGYYKRGPTPVPKGSIPSRFSTSSEDDAIQFVDDQHMSYSSNKKIVNQFKDLKNSTRGSHSRGGPTLKSQLISTAVVKEPVVKVLEKGFDLDSVRKPWCCFGENSWNGRNYAQGLSTDFSSPRLSTKEEALAGSVDFISDWSNVKALYKAHGSDSHLSFLLHRIDNSVTIDHLDLSSVMLFPGFAQLPPHFVNFVMDIVGDNKAKVKAEGRSNKEVLAKEAFHKTLHASMKRTMKVDFSKTQGSSKGHFLHHALLSSDKFKILAGSDTPVFVSEMDEATLTVRSNNGSTIDPLDAYDLWLDNTLLKCPKSIVAHQKDGKITKSQEIRTSDLPSVGKFDLANYMEHGDKLLKFLKDNVKPGYSYWLYRAPGSIRMSLYNVSNISTRKECDGNTSPQQHIFERWPLLQPYLPYFGTAALLEYSKLLSDVATDKLTSETVYEPPDAGAIIEDVKKNAVITDKAAATAAPKKAESGSKLTNGNVQNSSKLQKHRQKFELLARLVQRYLPPEDSHFIIRSLDEISCKHINRFVICIRTLYTIAIALTPNLQNKIYRHAVELYFTVCCKLKRSIGSSNERLKYWEVDFKMRQFMISYYEGVCSILSCLSDWHGQVNDLDSLDDAKRQEWMYMACQMNVMHADTFATITRKVYEKLKIRLPADETLPSVKNHETILSLYEKALDQIPNPKTFQVKDPYVGYGSWKTIQVSRDKLLIEVRKKLCVAYLDAARFFMTFPPYFHYVVGSPTQPPDKKKTEVRNPGKTLYARADHEEIHPSAFVPPEELTKMRVKENNDRVFGLLQKCIECSEKVGKTDEQLKSVRVLANSIMGCMKARGFLLENAHLTDNYKSITSYARSIEAALDSFLSAEFSTINDCDACLESNPGGNRLTHCKTLQTLFREEPVSDGLVMYRRACVNGETMSESNAYFARVRQEELEGTKFYEDLKKCLGNTMDTAAFEVPLADPQTEGEKCQDDPNLD